MLPKLHNIDALFRKDLLNRIDVAIRNDEEIEKVLEIIDQKLLVEKLGINKELCNSCRLIWKKMQKRRLKRG